ncbi:MAG: hypothetical protein ACUVTH_12230 [Thermogutta sp.]
MTQGHSVLAMDAFSTGKHENIAHLDGQGRGDHPELLPAQSVRQEEHGSEQGHMADEPPEQHPR